MIRAMLSWGLKSRDESPLASGRQWRCSQHAPVKLLPVKPLALREGRQKSARPERSLESCLHKEEGLAVSLENAKRGNLEREAASASSDKDGLEMAMERAGDGWRIETEERKERQEGSGGALAQERSGTTGG